MPVNSGGRDTHLRTSPLWPTSGLYLISFLLSADNIAIYKAGAVISRLQVTTGQLPLTWCLSEKNKVKKWAKTNTANSNSSKNRQVYILKRLLNKKAVLSQR